MTLQNRIWASRIRNLPTDQDVSPAEAESPPVEPQQPEAEQPEASTGEEETTQQDED